jgi:hypothetical protein
VSESGIRTAIKAIVSGVSNVGNVYDYERWAAFANGKDTLAVATISGSEVVRFWTISCTGCVATLETFAGDVRRAWSYTISGAVGLDDSAASEKTAIALAEDIMDALDGAATIHTSTEVTDGRVHPAQLRIFENRLIAGLLCHYIEITQTVSEVV